jgi:16S rRNA (adenine1518-N6/adenine1519-N6)-dimethyltransferase
MKYAYKVENPNKAAIKATLRKLAVKPQKARGQNFLQNSTLSQEIASAVGSLNEANVLEIGPGLGSLTTFLSERARHLTLVELEEHFVENLTHQFPQAAVLQGDARFFDYSKVIPEGKRLIVFGNIPYSCSTEILFQILEYRTQIDRAVLLVQREFAERIAAPPGSKSYGVPSVMTQVYATPRLGLKISGENFVPSTKVTSQLLILEMKPHAAVTTYDMPLFRRVVRGAFFSRRRTLLNSLCASGLFNRERIISALNGAKVDGKRRGETLSITEFAELANHLV